MRGLGHMFLGALSLAVLAGCGPAQDTPGARAAHARHEKFEALGKAFKALGDEAKRTTPDAARMAQHAAAVDDLAQQLTNWFPDGSGPQDGVKTHAYAKVWTDPVGFAEKARALQEKSAALRASAPDGVVAMQGHIADVGAACGACHKIFREKK